MLLKLQSVASDSLAIALLCPLLSSLHLTILKTLKRQDLSYKPGFNGVTDPGSTTTVNFRYPLSTILFITVAYKKKQDEQDRRRHDDQDDEPFSLSEIRRAFL